MRTVDLHSSFEVIHAESQKPVKMPAQHRHFRRDATHDIGTRLAGRHEHSISGALVLDLDLMQEFRGRPPISKEVALI